jgi:hypothetical protein
MFILDTSTALHRNKVSYDLFFDKNNTILCVIPLFDNHGFSVFHSSVCID